tara:strand:+ start:29820 stop:33926 length:4107 start_codon:yes stop_codon:yes gene_type:complete
LWDNAIRESLVKFDLNEAIRDVLDFLRTHWKHSLAKYIIWPSMVVGLSSLSIPLWIEILNWVLVNQNFLPDYQFPLVQPNYPLGASLIGFSALIYFIDVWLKKNIHLKNLEFPSQIADEITTRMKEIGFTAPHLQDEKIENQINKIALLRFFGTFPKDEKAIDLAESIIDGELSGGTPQVKARALALLARYLCVGEKADYAEKWLSTSIKLCQTEEAEIARAFINAVGSSNSDAASSLLKISSPSNYAAFFMIKNAVEGSEVALKWFESAGLNVQELDVDGKVTLVSVLLLGHQWEKALNIVNEIDDDFFIMSPALAQLSAFSYLVNAIKVTEFREVVINSIPLAAERFPLADDAESIVLRGRAIELFKECSKLAKQLGAEDVANMSDSYILWLKLRDSQTHEQAKEQLQHYFINYNQKTLEYLPLAFAFGIDIDFESIENEVNKQTALRHGNDSILGLARFILAQKKKPITAVVEYIALHRAQIEKGVNPIAINMLEIEVLARAGLVDDAELILQKLVQSGVADSEVRNLNNIIGAAKGEDPIALAINHYQVSKATNDLEHLVDLLEKGNFRDKYYTHSLELFERTGQEYDAIRVCNAASSIGRFSELHQFLLKKIDFVKRSDGLQAHWAWSLFRKGDLAGAREQVTLLKKSKTQQYDLKSLEVNLSIFCGDWESLSVFVEDGWNNRHKLEADELLQTAQLAKAVSPGRARQLLEFCTGKFPEDPKVLASAYFTATTMGWEDNQEASEWLNKAIVLSDEDGPLQRATFEDLKQMIPEARDKNEKVYKAYLEGEAPIFTVAELLNRTMSDFFLIQSLENKKTKDIRRKNLIPIFHAARLEQIVVGETIAIDISSALVMENIGLIGHLFDCFERIVVPHSFMRCLFEEKQKVAFHQPSQIEKSKYFERLISDSRISVFHPKKINNPELALDVGDELAFMLEEANANSSEESQTLVVCSCPVYKVGGSFREMEVDLSTFQHLLISCSQLIKKLEEMAVITEAQCLKAISYLCQHETEWPNKLELVSGARLFLDSLSITYLMTVDMLDKLSDAGFEVYVLKDERDRYRALINYDSTINQVAAKIENIRKLFFSGITSGKVTLAEMPLNREQVAVTENNFTRSTEEFFEAVKLSDAALIDDRFINRHGNIKLGGKTVPIFTSLDFIETLYDQGLISKVQKLDSRALLRELGYEFINISSDELENHLSHSSLVGGELKLTRQLSLIRESLLLVRVSSLVKLPRDAQWLEETLKVISKAIRAQWSEDIPLELSRVRSCWLYDLLGNREWAQTHQLRGDGGMAYFGEVLRVNSILIPPETLSNEGKEDYKAWLDEFILTPLRDLDPWSFRHVTDSMKQQVKSISQQNLFEKELND